MTGLAWDEVVKNCLTDHAAEEFEVGSYRALLAAATTLGDQQTVAICEQTIREDQARADCILASLPMAVAEMMARSAAEASSSS